MISALASESHFSVWSIGGRERAAVVVERWVRVSGAGKRLLWLRSMMRGREDCNYIQTVAHTKGKQTATD